MQGMTGSNYVLVKRAPDKASAAGIEIPAAYRRGHMQWHGEVLYQARVKVVSNGIEETVTLNPGAVVWFESCRAEFEHPEHGEIAIVRVADVVFVEANAPANSNAASG